ncbi:unnamed protein product [Effrenium voratum]|uniref:Uncharacterized protein n=1 Tax=Effrenium voratum TaxID=2562239 RepID=A0AA36HYT6_9DINO|nr:unnamed protein product [Effrenium voratum]CAJ1430934.1 unnamed protein product [Effrenium voratum]
METPLLACAAPVSSLCASPELGLVAVGDTSGSVTLLDLSSGRVRASLATSGDPVLCVALAAPLRAALGAGGRAAKESSTVAVWDVDSGALRAEMKYKHLVTCLIFVPALHAAITGDGSFDQRSSTGRVVLWNPDTLEQHRKLQCAGAVTSLLYHQGLILSADRSRSICTWHPENGEKLQEFQVDSGQLPWCLSAANEGRFAYSVCNFKENFGCFCLRGPAGLEQSQVCDHPVLSIAFLPSAPVVALGLRSGELVLWDLEARRPRRTVRLGSAVNALALNLVRGELLAGEKSGAVSSWPLAFLLSD